jgi:hypothetical protein
VGRGLPLLVGLPEKRPVLVWERLVVGPSHGVLAAPQTESRRPRRAQWDLATGAQVGRLTFDAVPRALAYSPTRRAVVVGDARGRVHVVQVIE